MSRIEAEFAKEQQKFPAVKEAEKGDRYLPSGGCTGTEVPVYGYAAE